MNVLKPHLQTTLSTLLQAGKSHREIERITGIDRKTIRTYHQRLTAEPSNSPRVATDPASQIPPPRPPAAHPLTVSACEPHRAFIEAQLQLRRNYTAIYQDLVDIGHAGSSKGWEATRIKAQICATHHAAGPCRSGIVTDDSGVVTDIPVKARNRSR